jgi:Uma2 family endonuclease
MTVEEFVAWSQTQERGRYELESGRIIIMASETLGHIRTKYRVMKALETAILASKADVFPLTDGATVRIDHNTAYEPDAMVYSSPELPDDAIEIPNPIIVVEVLSPSWGTRDGTQKLKNYFTVATIQNYLIVDPENRLVVHHRRGKGTTFATEILGSGTINLIPPGLTVQVADFFPSA